MWKKRVIYVCFMYPLEEYLISLSAHIDGGMFSSTTIFNFFSGAGTLVGALCLSLFPLHRMWKTSKQSNAALDDGHWWPQGVTHIPCSPSFGHIVLNVHECSKHLDTVYQVVPHHVQNMSCISCVCICACKAAHLFMLTQLHLWWWHAHSYQVMDTCLKGLAVELQCRVVISITAESLGDWHTYLGYGPEQPSNCRGI